ncbi:MAG: 4Fe-4S binding protein, partial [Methanomassiliicoccales archaeon]
MLPSTGVFICQCGGNISDAVDIPWIKGRLREEGVEVVRDFPYLCSEEGQAMIRGYVSSGRVDRVVVAACSPNMHEHTFRACAKSEGLNPGMVDIANVREQCAWADPDNPTGHALDVIRSSVYAIQYAVPHEDRTVEVQKRVAVIGGGISGITAARSLSSLGIMTYLIERGPTIGGNMVKVGKVISPEKLSEECSMCSLSPLMVEVSRSDHIEMRTLTRVVGCEGSSGGFTLELESGPSYVDPQRCRACGRCLKVCPTTVPDEWNSGLTLRKAVYRPFPQSVPSSLTIDSDSCTGCGECERVCGLHAIDLSRGTERERISVGAVVLATGYEEFDPRGYPELGHGKYPGVVTQMELARMLSVNGPTGGRPEIGGKIPDRVVMIQCVGSRDSRPGTLSSCSKVCCTIAMKHANQIRRHFPQTEVVICYTDMRVQGTYENYLQEAQESGVRLLRGRAGEVVKGERRLVVRVEDTLGGGVMGLNADMVVLSCAMLPSAGTLEMTGVLGLNSTPEYFIQEKHPKLDPGCTTSRGVFVCGTASGPKDITDCITQALSTSFRVAEMMLSPIDVGHDFATIDGSICRECGRCLSACPNGAISRSGEGYTINPLFCKGLGVCLSSCQERAISLPGHSDEEIFARMDGCLRGEGPKVLAFLDKNIGYVAADHAGMNRMSYPSSIRIIRVPSVLTLNRRHLLHAFERGAAGIFLGDGLASIPGGMSPEKVSDHVERLRADIVQTGIDPGRLFYYKAYLPHF